MDCRFIVRVKSRPLGWWCVDLTPACEEMEEISVVRFNLRDGGKEETLVNVFIQTPSSESQKRKKKHFLYSVSLTPTDKLSQSRELGIIKIQFAFHFNNLNFVLFTSTE